jgi:hypothetical protein
MEQAPIMRSTLLLYALLPLAACGPSRRVAADEIVGHRWARTLAECRDTYLSFSRDMIDFFRDGQSVSPLPVRRIVADLPGGKVMFVIEVDGALAVRPVGGRGDDSDVAMVFRVDGDTLQLVDQGLLGRLGNSYPRFTMRRCPSAY